MSTIWNRLNTGDRQQDRENHPGKTYDGASYADREVGDGARRFNYNFSNIALATKVNT
jgi:hypothetical protein